MNETMENDLTILFVQSANLLNHYQCIPITPNTFSRNRINEKVSLKKALESEVYNRYEGNYGQILNVISALTTKEDLDHLFEESITSALEDKPVFLIKNRVIIRLYAMLLDALDNNKMAMINREIQLDFIKTIIYFLNESIVKPDSLELEAYLKSIRNNLAFLYDDIEGSRMPFTFVETSQLIWKSQSLCELYGISSETYTKMISNIVRPIFSFALYNLHYCYAEKSSDENMVEALKIIIRVCLLFYGIKDMTKLDDLLKGYQDSEKFNNSFEDCLNSYYHDKSLPSTAILGRFK